MSVLSNALLSCILDAAASTNKAQRATPISHTAASMPPIWLSVSFGYDTLRATSNVAVEPPTPAVFHVRISEIRLVMYHNQITGGRVPALGKSGRDYPRATRL